MKVGVAIDAWKLDVFAKHLERDGFEYKQAPGIVPDTLTLSIVVAEVDPLYRTVKRANEECATLVPPE